MDYFPHDTDASSDEKVEAMRALFGNNGYAFYFIMLERIYRSSGGFIGISDEDTKQVLCRKIGVGLSEFEAMAESAVKFGLFDKSSYEKKKILTSKGIKKRMNAVTQKRIYMRKAYEKARGGARVFEAVIKQDNDRRVSDTVKTKEKSKEKIKEKNGLKNLFKAPALFEVEDYCKKRNNGVDAAVFFDFYESKGWLVGKTKMKDWKAAVRTWEKRMNSGGVNDGRDDGNGKNGAAWRGYDLG